METEVFEWLSTLTSGKPINYPFQCPVQDLTVHPNGATVWLRPLNIWHHFAIVGDDWYFDGVLVGVKYSASGLTYGGVLMSYNNGIEKGEGK